MAELLGGEVGDRLARDVRDAHPERQAVDERAHDDVAALLGLARVHIVDVQRVVVHGDQAEEVVVVLGDRLGRPVLVDGADLELLEVPPVAVRAAGLALGLIRGEGAGFGAHEGRESAARALTRSWTTASPARAGLGTETVPNPSRDGTSGTSRGSGRRTTGS